jgi:hypothetical protein
MKTNDIKSGHKIQLANGWHGTMKDNMRGNIRLAEVEGFETELGSVYAHDIKRVLNLDNNIWEIVEHTPAQIKLKAMVG